MEEATRRPNQIHRENGPKHCEEEEEDQRQSQLKAFDETKAGVKGLVDAGITKLSIFIIPPPPQQTLQSSPPAPEEEEDTITIIPTIDLEGIHEDEARWRRAVEAAREASETWGFFQVTNHGIPGGVVEEIISGVRGLFEQETEAKKEWYTRDLSKSLVYNSNFDLFRAPSARDTFFCPMAPNPPHPQELPPICRLEWVTAILYLEVKSRVDNWSLINGWVGIVGVEIGASTLAQQTVKYL